MTLRSSVLLSGLIAALALTVLGAAPRAEDQQPGEKKPVVSIIDILKLPAPEPPPEAGGQQPSQLPSPVGEDGVIRVSVEVVNMSVTVTDDKGKVVNNLTKDDFVILEDGKETPIVNFRAITSSKETPLPIGLGLVLDVSLSISNEQWGIIRTVVDDLVKKRLNNEDELYFVEFAGTTSVIHPLTSDKKSVMDAIRRVKRREGTAIYDGIVMGLSEQKKAKHKKQVMLVLTDGADTNSSNSRTKVAELARQSEVMIYALVIDGDGEMGGMARVAAGQGAQLRQSAAELRQVTDASGGRTIYVQGFGELEREMENFGKDFTTQYEIAFERGGEADGKYHNVRVGVKRQGVTVRHRLGYVAD